MDYNNQGYQQHTDGAFGWDDEIQQEDAFVLLPEGDYWFKIKKVDKGRYDGGDKISACPKAIVEFEVTAPDGTTMTLTENFLLHQKMEWKLSQFFAAIGMKQKGEKLRMNWSPVIIGKTGVCKVIVHTYTKDGNERQTNRIDKLYPSYDQPQLSPPVQTQAGSPRGQVPPNASQMAAYTPQGYQPNYPQNAPTFAPNGALGGESPAVAPRWNGGGR